MRRTIRLAAVLATLLACAPPPGTRLENGSQTASGIVAFLEGDLRQAERLLRSAVAHDTRDTLALYYLAQAYLARGTPDGRNAAEEALASLTRINPDQSDYLSALASLRMEQGYVFNARKVMSDLLAIAPDDPGILFTLARLAEKDWWRFQARQDLEQVHALYQRVLAIEPDHRQSLIRMAVMAFEADSIEVAAGFVDRLLASHPDDDDTRSLEGILLEQRGRFDEAERVFRRVIGDLPPFHQPAFLEPTLLEPESDTIWDTVEGAVPDWIDGEGSAGEDTLAALRAVQYDEKLWVERDPTPGTRTNERFVVHASRALMADFLYGNPDDGFRGWETAPGEFYVRYGKPIHREYRIESRPLWLHTFNVGNSKAVLTFVDYTLNGNFILPIEYDPTPLYATLRYNLPENTGLDERMPMAALLNRMTWFRAPSGEPRLDIAMAAAGGARLCQASVLDSNWVELYHSSELVESRDLPASITSDPEIGVFTLSLYPGERAAHVQVALSTNGAVNGTVGPPPPRSGFTVSDLQLAVLHRGEFLPNPGYAYPSGAPLGLEFEVYDVRRDAAGLGYLTLELSVLPEEGARKGLSRLILGEVEPSFITSRLEEEVRARDWRRSLEIDTSELPEGRYRARLTVEDALQRTSVTREAAFEIAER